MKIMMPDKETFRKRGWIYQVQWIAEGKECFQRFHSGAFATDFYARMAKDPAVTEINLYKL